MADITAADVTYTIDSRRYVPGLGYSTVVKMAFGDGLLTIPAAGVPLTKEKMGCPNVIKSFKLIESEATGGLVWAYDMSTNKLLQYIGNYDAADGPLITSVTAPAAQEVWAEVDGY